MELADKASPTSPRKSTAGGWTRRAVVGLAMAWIWCSLVSHGWVGLAALSYGDFDRALIELKSAPWAPGAVTVSFATISASAVAGVAGPLWIGLSRKSVMLSSALSAALSMAVVIM